MLFSSNWTIDKALSGATTPNQSESGSDVNERELHISQSSSITGTLFCVSYPGHSLRGDEVLLLCREAVGVLYTPSRLANSYLKW